jgi:acetylornithine deacetylase/succinyl-diaminopimelate desuccinylase-like protein
VFDSLLDARMDKKYSKHQQRIIKNYYENRDAISLQRLSELVTELYLSEGKARERQWKYIIAALEKLGLPEARIEHLRKKDDPKLLANLVEELMAKQK